MRFKRRQYRIDIWPNLTCDESFANVPRAYHVFHDFKNVAHITCAY